ADLAGKTGTTNEWFDAWYSGFNRDVVVTTWVGFDDPRTLGEKEFGGVVALPMWISFMEMVLKDKPEHTLEPPPGIVSVKIDPNTGLLAHDDQPGAVAEFFTEDTLPTGRGSSAGMFDEAGGNSGGGYGTSVEALF
ncbi:MAG: peptidase, partial [Gammaproteobacteria bacterium]|nr:peptidase [Gammaproteobacteria bacterium]